MNLKSQSIGMFKEIKSQYIASADNSLGMLYVALVKK